MPCGGVSELIGKHTTKGLPEYPVGAGEGDFQPSRPRVEAWRWRLPLGNYGAANIKSSISTVFTHLWTPLHITDTSMKSHCSRSAFFPTIALFAPRWFVSFQLHSTLSRHLSGK